MRSIAIAAIFIKNCAESSLFRRRIDPALDTAFGSCHLDRLSVLAGGFVSILSFLVSIHLASPMTHTLSRDHIVYSLDRANPPALEIDPGDTVRLETFDARTGTIQSDNDLLDHAHPEGANPATGPISIRGAEPGDHLAVTIHAIDLAPEGFLAIKEDTGLLASRARRFATHMVGVEDGIVHYSDKIRLPARPMVGVIGTAPEGDGLDTLYAGPNGGNMDNRYVTTGSVVHLPVSVPGGGLGIGDIHAAMGDGEITMIGLEICAEVTVTIDLVKDEPVSRPWIETANEWITTGDHIDTTEALRISADEMVNLLQRKLAIGFEDAYMLMSAAGDVQICQLCGPGTLPVTTRAVFPKPSP